VVEGGFWTMSESREIAYVAVGDNHSKLVAQIISSPGWIVAPRLDSLQLALQGYASGRYAAVILEDTQQYPAALHILREIRNPLLMLAPVLVVLDRDRVEDEHGFSTHFGFTTIVKPISRMMVIQGFSALTKRITSPSGITAAACARALVQSDQDITAALNGSLVELAKDPGFVHRVANARALAGLRAGLVTPTIDAINRAEAELLRHAKSHPGNIIAFIILGTIYAELSMTVLAKRLMQSASSAAPRFSLTSAIQAQMHLMLGEMEDAILVLLRLLRMRYMPEDTSFSLAKLYCSLGRLDEAEKILAGQAGRFHVLKAAWVEGK